jgi:hypothetical protein
MDNEKDGDLNKPAQWGRLPTRQTSVNLEVDLWETAKRNLIEFKDALVFGIKFKLADADGFGNYPPCNIITKLHTNIAKFQQLLNEANEKIEEFEKGKDLDKKMDELSEDAEKEADDVFGGIVKDE